MINLLTILGPTATGKTQLAANLAANINGEIISADSRQVYRGMDIGTGKDIEDYLVNGKKINYHLVDIVDAGYEFNVFEFQKSFSRVFPGIIKRNKVPILCGGSGMYLDAILRQYSMAHVPVNEKLRIKLSSFSDDDLYKSLKTYRDLHNTSDITDRARTIRAIEIAEWQIHLKETGQDKAELHALNFGIHFERMVIRERITKRLNDRLENGMIEEVEGLLTTGLNPEQLIFYGLEYKFVTRYLTGELTYDEMFSKLNTAIHQFAKRQMTWFRRMEKKGVVIHWIDGNLPMNQKVDLIFAKIQKENK